MPSSWVATLLDQEQIERTGNIASRPTAVESLPDRPGGEVSDELGGRLLLRYLTLSQLTEFNQGSTDREHWVTTTPVAPEDVVSWLGLVAAGVPRNHALLLDPAKISKIRGPAWIRLGQGLEYFLPDGFTKNAIFDVGIIQVR